MKSQNNLANWSVATSVIIDQLIFLKSCCFSSALPWSWFFSFFGAVCCCEKQEERFLFKQINTIQPSLLWPQEPLSVPLVKNHDSKRIMVGQKGKKKTMILRTKMVCIVIKVFSGSNKIMVTKNQWYQENNSHCLFQAMFSRWIETEDSIVNFCMSAEQGRNRFSY